MKERIIQHIHDPEMLEMLFRSNEAGFTRSFSEATVGLNTDLVNFWRIRLKDTELSHPQTSLKKGLTAFAVISIITASLSRLPLFIKSIDPEAFYVRDLGLIVFTALTSWYVIKNKISGWRNILLLAIPISVLAIFLNILPYTLTDTSILSLIHAPLFMGFIFALAWISFEFKNTAKVSGFIRFCGELVIITGLLAIAGAILSGMTILLFEIIGIKIEKFYTENVAIIGVSVLPLAGAWLIDLYPGITERIAPVIARVFTPLVLLSAGIYLAVIAFSGISLSKNRDLLLIFNILLLTVMAIIVFSLSELDKSEIRKLNVILLFILAVLTLLIDLFALSAIISRLTEGFTPNRTVVLVSNILILANLLLVLPDLYLAGFRGKSLDRMERNINRYLPVYFIYCIVVIFIFPLVF